MKHQERDGDEFDSDVQYVTIDVFCRRTGYTEKAVRRKIQNAKWPEGVLYMRAPDGRIFIDLRAWRSWVASPYRAV